MIVAQSLAAFVGFVMIVVAMPMYARKVKPNLLYGLRVRATFADQWVWYEANAASGRDMLMLGAVILALSALPVVIEISEARFGSVLLVTLLGGTLLLAFVGWRRANRLLDEREASGEPLNPGPIDFTLFRRSGNES